MKTHLVSRFGKTTSDPNLDELKAALAELSISDREHPDCWLSNEKEWSIAAFESGIVILENSETNEGPWHLRDVSEDQILELWQLLSDGEMDRIRSLPWKTGYGS